MKRFEGESSRQKAYIKRKEKIIRKAQELTTLCESDLGLLMFSPDGQLTSFCSNGRVEDTFIRFLELADKHKRGPIENAEQLAQKLRGLKKEAEVLEKMATIKALQENLNKINRRTEELREKLRFYNPDVEKINSAAEAELHEQFLINAIERIKQSKEKLFREQAVWPAAESIEGKFLSEQIVKQDARSYENKFGKQIVQQDGDCYKDKWLGKRIVGQGTSSHEIVADGMKYLVPFADHSANTIKRRPGRPRKNPSLHMNTNLSNELIQAQMDWNMQGDQNSSMMNSQILQQATINCERVADAMKSPVLNIDQSTNTNKRRRGRPRKNRSPHISNNFIQAQNDWNLQGGQHFSKQI